MDGSGRVTQHPSGNFEQKRTSFRWARLGFSESGLKRRSGCAGCWADGFAWEWARTMYSLSKVRFAITVPVEGMAPAFFGIGNKEDAAEWEARS